MSHKQVTFESAARERVLRGVSALANAVRVTLGPKSKRVLIEKKWGTPLVCDDGVSIAKEFELEEKVATISAHNDPKMGELVAEAVEKVGDEGVISVEEVCTIRDTPISRNTFSQAAMKA